MTASGISFRHHTGTQPASVSSGDRAGYSAGSAFDMHRFRVVLRDRWADLLKRHFRDSVHIAFFFDVDEKTARNWLGGVTGPSGPALARAITAMPGAAAVLLAEAA